MICCFAYSPVDQELAEKSSAWIIELGKNHGHRAVIVNDVRCNPNLVRSIEHNLKLAFDSVETVTVNDKVDGWPMAPNIVFRTAAKHIQFINPEPWLFLEADCVVLKSGWMESLWKEYQQAMADGKVFLSDFVNVPDVIPHASGISVYPPVLVDHAPSAVFALATAWDCFAADEIVPKMKQTALIKHRWKHPPFNNQSEVDNLLGQLGDAVLFHADKSGTLINFLRERAGNRSAEGPERSIHKANLGLGSIPSARTVPATLSHPGNQNALQSTGRGLEGPSCDIFIKSYPNDYEWLGYCLESVLKRTIGFRRTVVVSSGDQPDPASSSVWDVDWRTLAEFGNDGYLSQQVFKMYADTFTDADYILHLDSDTIFTRHVSPETYLRDGKPVWMMTPIDQAHPNQSHAWREVMEKFMGKKAEFEFMRRFPFLIPRWAYGAFREFCKQKHGMELKDYIMAQPYRRFSEFNCIGFYLYEYHRDKFFWVDTSSMPESEWPVLTVDQKWSVGGLTDEIKEAWDKVLAGGDTSQGAVEIPLSDNGAGRVVPDSPTPSLSDEIRYHTSRLHALVDGKQGRKQMVLAKLRELGLAPKAKKR